MESKILNATELTELQHIVQEQSQFVDVLRKELSKSIKGQQYMLDRLLLALLTNGHILLEGVPGLAKTLAIKSLSEAVAVDFSRIQFTPDLLPADIVGTMIFQNTKELSKLKKDQFFPIFF